MSFSENVVQLQSEGANFSVTIIEPDEPRALVIFAAGRGGSPVRHLPLLRALAENGSAVVAPHFDMIPGHIPTKEQLETRIQQLEITLTNYNTTALPIIGLGHSIGATLLLALAGAKAVTFAKEFVETSLTITFNGMVLLAPATDFFLHPAALSTLNANIYLRTGSKDNVTPPDRTISFKNMLQKKNEITFVLDENAGHFSYMDQLPPNVEDTQPQRQAFLAALAKDVTEYITSMSRVNSSSI